MGGDRNKRVVRDGYRRFIDGDVEGLVKRLAEDVEWVYPPGTPFSGHRRGRGEVREFFEALARVASVDNFSVSEYIAEGDRVVAMGESRLTSRDSGQHAETRWAHVITLRGGKVARVELYDDSDSVASLFGESAGERRAQLGPMGVTEPPFSGYDDR